MRFQRIAIVGSGAVGLYYGGLLARAGREVQFLLRSDLDAVRKKGIRLLLPEENLQLHPVNAHETTTSIGPVDLVIIALKTTANRILPQLIPPLLNPGTTILTLQNGLGNEAFLAQHFGDGRILGGLCFICLNRTAPGEVTNLHKGSLTIGSHLGGSDDRPASVAELFRAAGVACLPAADLREARWRKLIWNVPFNGLTIAAGGLDTEKLLAEPALTAEVKALMREIQASARALGMEIEDSFLQQQLEVTQTMGAYRPSSLVDFESRRPLEVDSIWGAPLAAAAKAGVATPRLSLLHALLKRLDPARDP